MRVKRGHVVAVDTRAGTAEISMDYADRKQTVTARVGAHGKAPEKGESWTVVQGDDSPLEWYTLARMREANEGDSLRYSGDVAWDTAAGNMVVLRRNGDIEISGGGIPGLAIIPARDLVRMDFIEWEMVSPQGSLTWKPCTLELALGANYGENTVVLRAGDAGTVFGADAWAKSANVRLSIGVGGSFHTEVAEDGSVSMVAKDLGVLVNQNLMAHVLGATSLTTETAYVKATSGLVEGGVLAIALEEKFTLTVPEAQVNVGLLRVNEADGPAVDGLKLLQWLATDFQVDSSGRITLASLQAFIKALNMKVWL